MNKHPFISILIAVLLLVGCNHLPIQEAPTQIPRARNSDATPVMVATNMPASAIPNTVLPHPTLTYELQDQLFALLNNNGDCNLPCFLGITPDETLWTNADTILEPFAYKRPIPYEYSRITSSNIAYSAVIQTTKDINILIRITTDVDQNGIVTHIMNHIEFWGYDSYYFDKHLLRYSISEIFRRNGPPSVIYFKPDFAEGRGYSLDIVYDNLKMVIEYSGRLRQNANGDYIICPNIGDGDIGQFDMGFASPASSIDVKTLITPPFWQDTPPFENTSGMSLKGFYNLMVGDKQPVCFSAKKLP